MRPQPIRPASGQESVWDYPRPPRLQRVPERLRVLLGGVAIADTMAGWRVCETTHPPTYYLPPADIPPGSLIAVPGNSWCEWKGRASYFDVLGGGKRAARAAWCYREPTAPFEPIREHVAFHASLMDSCWVGDEQVVPQPGGFYGGWITSCIVGPFKGVPGSTGW